MSFISSEFNPYAHITFECVFRFQNLIFMHRQQFLLCFSFSFFSNLILVHRQQFPLCSFIFEFNLNTQLFQHLSLYFYSYEFNLFFLISSSVAMFWWNVLIQFEQHFFSNFFSFAKMNKITVQVFFSLVFFFSFDLYLPESILNRIIVGFVLCRQCKIWIISIDGSAAVYKLKLFYLTFI